MLKIFQIGYLGSDPDMRYLPSGSAVTNFSVASTRKWTTKEGVAGEETTWIRWSAFGRLAEIVNEYLAKGRQVHVEGRLRPDDNGSPRVFTRNNGEPGASYEATASSVQFLSGGNGSTGTSADKDATPGSDVGEPEIPF